MTTAPACCCVQQQLSDLRRLNRCLEHQVRPAGVRGEINFGGMDMPDKTGLKSAERSTGGGLGALPQKFLKN